MRKKRHTLEEVNQIFKSKGCILLALEYINNDTPLEYICGCGNHAFSRLRAFIGYCRKCAYKKSFNTNRKNHNGLLAVQTIKYVENRKKTLLKKYGVEHALNYPEFLAKKEKTCIEKYGNKNYLGSSIGKRKIKQVLMERYGVEYSLQISSAKKALKKTLLLKYGVPSLAYLSRCASKQSQKLFWKIYALLPEEHQKHTHFAELNKEFVITFEKFHFKYDFIVTSLKTVIEFNGTNFHPRLDQDENEIGWCAFHPNLTVKEAREYEKIKKDAIEQRGYKLYYIWDTGFKKKFMGLVNICLNILLLPQWGKEIERLKKESLICQN